MAGNSRNPEVQALVAQYEAAREAGMNAEQAVRHMIADGHALVPVCAVLLAVWGMGLPGAKQLAIRVCEETRKDKGSP